MSRSWSATVQRLQHQFGDRLDLSEISEKFLPYYESGERIKVRDADMEVTGTVSMTTGWRPCLLLMRRSSDHGSSHLLLDRTELIAVQRGRKYVPVP